MDKYYYFVSQLPALFFDRETYLTIEDYLREAQKWLSERDYEILSGVDIDDVAQAEKAPGALCDYRDFETRLRNDLVRWREAQRAEGEHRPSMFPVSAVKEGNPLDVEKKLLRVRWDFIEQQAQEHHFDLAFLILYLLKLQILRRLFTFDREKGLKIFQTLCEVAP